MVHVFEEMRALWRQCKHLHLGRCRALLWSYPVVLYPVASHARSACCKPVRLPYAPHGNTRNLATNLHRLDSGGSKRLCGAIGGQLQHGDVSVGVLAWSVKAYSAGCDSWVRPVCGFRRLSCRTTASPSRCGMVGIKTSRRSQEDGGGDARAISTRRIREGSLLASRVPTNRRTGGGELDRVPSYGLHGTRLNRVSSVAITFRHNAGEALLSLSLNVAKCHRPTSKS